MENQENQENLGKQEKLTKTKKNGENQEKQGNSLFLDLCHTIFERVNSRVDS